MKVVWTQPARNDLRKIGNWIGRNNPAAALRMVRRIRKAVSHLSRHPYLGRPGRHRDERELVISGTPYIVPHRLEDRRVDILAVFHGAGEWPEQFEDR
jgi:toxin ParE1/3/4